MVLWRLISTLVTGEAGNYIARLKRIAGLYAVMGVFAVATLASLTGALAVFLANRYGALETALGFAAVSFLLTLLCWIGVVILRRPPKTRADDRLKRDIASIAGVAALTNASQLVNVVKRRKSLLLLPMTAAGGWAIWRAIKAIRDRSG